MIALPIDPYIPEILNAWDKEKNIIISASPGSGKTTRLPWALSQKSHKRIIVLEPRKLAAKMAATRMAQENQVNLGEEVGYAYRDDICFSEKSRVIFFTEGTFIRFLNDDKFLQSVHTIIFDEFHEKHLETDLCLALVRKISQDYPDLKIVLMSATIDSEIAGQINAKSIEIHSQFYSVKTHYLPNQPSILNQELGIKVINIVKGLPLEGDILVFLPGMREILRTQEILKENFGKVCILHSEIEKSEQEAIMLHSKERKIILATNIAESSLTIPGIKYVIDSGIARMSEYNPWTGIKRLIDRPITQASAIQRMYRAGRTQDGECFRLYSEFDYNERPKYTIPQVLTAELNDTYLLSCYYHHKLKWPTPPPEEKWKKAALLNELLGMSKDGHITSIGRFALTHNLDIRIAKILWEAKNLSKKDKEQLLHYISKYITQEDPKYLRRRLVNYLSVNGSENMEDMVRFILPGMVDQVAKYRRQYHDFIHYSGRSLKINQSKTHFNEGLYVLISVNQREQVEEALMIQEEWLIDLDPYPLKENQDISWNNERIIVSLKTNLGSLVLEEQSLPKEWIELNQKEREEFIKKNSHKFETLLKNFTHDDFYKRALFYSKITQKEFDFNPPFEELLDYDQGSLKRSFEFFKYKLEEALGVNIDYEVPEFIFINKKKFTILYTEEASIEGYVQDFYGVDKTPTIMNNIPLTLILLGPHKRPIQYTKDLKGFWSRTYQEMLKECRREYPRHHWPDEPARALPILLKRHLPLD